MSDSDRAMLQRAEVQRTALLDENAAAKRDKDLERKRKLSQLGRAIQQAPPEAVARWSRDRKNCRQWDIRLNDW
eukprot:10301954-Alexandrium_andersonii.AAC.1